MKSSAGRRPGRPSPAQPELEVSDLLMEAQAHGMEQARLLREAQTRIYAIIWSQKRTAPGRDPEAA